MKKYLYLIALALATTAQADFWDNCTAYGGTIITANSYGNDKVGLCNDPNDSTKTNNCNGKRFCMNNKGTNWWSSITWCESIGGKLASFSSLCPGVIADSSGSGDCPNATGINSSYWGWTSMGWGTKNALNVRLSTGAVTNHDRSSSFGYRSAICEE